MAAAGLKDGLKWVWFDLDDTLMDFHANSRLAHRLLYDEAGFSRFYDTPEEWIEVYEAHNLTLWDRYSRGEITQDFLRVDRFATPLRPRWDGSEDSLVAASKRLDVDYLRLLAEQTVLIDGAVELLAHLRVHYNIGVLSNGFKEVQHLKLRNSGLEPMVDLVVLSDDIGVNKPDRRLFDHAMDRAGETAPRAHLMIGDNPSTDIAGALGAGWQAILLDPSAATLSDAGTHFVTPRLDLISGLL